MHELLSEANAAIERTNRSRPSVAPEDVSAAGSNVARAVGFVEACSLLAPALLIGLDGELNALQTAVAGLGFLSVRVALSVATTTDRRSTPRIDLTPRRQAVRRLVPDRRTSARRVRSDRRGG
jgi:hypothetical protein